MGRLTGRRALVTGASSGIGAAIALALLAEGAEVHGLARRESQLRDVLGEENLATGRAHTHAVDLTDRPAVDRLLDETLAGSPVDIVVAAAGRNVTDRAAGELTGESLDAVLGLNLTATAYLAVRTARAMRGRGGDVVLIASVSGTAPDHAGPAYGASKSGLVAFGRGLGKEFHGDGVRVCSILPGIVDTPLLDKRPVVPPAEVRRWCMRPEDVAATVIAAVTLPPRAYIPELTVLATRLQAIGHTQHATPPLPEGLESIPSDRFEVLP